MDYNFKGAFDPSQNYIVKDVVSYTQNGITKYFMCINPVYNTNPQNPSTSNDTLYWGLMNTSSNFPQSVDSFIFRANIQGQDKVDIARINELTLKTDLTTSEQDELNNLIIKHRNKLFLADDLNAIQDSVSNLQMFFKDKIDSKLNQNINDIKTVRDDSMAALDAKKASLDLYLDSTTAGALRVDIGMMGDLTTFDKSSLVAALNETRANSQSFAITNSDGTAKVLASGVDLNTITGTGFYNVPASSANAPTTDGGTLEVFKADNNQVVQRFSKAIIAETYQRVKGIAGWSGWVKIATNAEAQMSKITSDTGGVKLNISDNTKDLLVELNALGLGFHTFYAVDGTKNLPNGKSSRGMFHNTGTNIGWAIAFDYTNTMYINYYNSGTWMGWKQLPTYSDTQTSLWTGTALMHAPSGVAQVVTPTKNLSDCRTGWLLLWSDYDTGVGANNYNWNSTYIPKFMGTNHNGQNWSIVLSAGTSIGESTDTPDKELTVYNDKIVGNDNNSQGLSADIVLRYVLEV